jgi:glycosyltransferase involved in cell wall biosynthesis
MNPLVSIITPTFNHEQYIYQCIYSVINQTYKNWEMMVIDDASIDKTFSIAKDFSKKDKRIKVIPHKTNWGIKRLKETYNQALKYAKGDLIAILEGDDFWPKDKLENQIKAFDNRSVTFSYGNWAMTNQAGKTVYIRSYQKFNKEFLNNNPSPSILNLFLTLQFDIGSQTVMIRKKNTFRYWWFQNDKYYPFVDVPTYLKLSFKRKIYLYPLSFRLLSKN